LKTEILRLRDEGTVLARTGDLNQRLQLTLPNLRFTLDELTTVIDLLAAPGLVWRLDFGGFVLLQPEQINSYAAAVIRQLRSAENELGIIAEDDVVQGRLKFDGMKRLPKADEDIVLHAMYQTFVDYGLCLRQKTDGGTQLVFPAFFGVERPEHPGMPPVFVTYRFAGNLDEIYATLVVRLHHTPAFEKDKLWRFAADFRSQTGAKMGLRLTRQKEGLGEIDVYFEPEADDGTKVAFIKYVHEHLLERTEDVQRLRHYVCPKCAHPFKDTEVALEILEEDGGKARVNCVKPKCRKPIPLWDAIEKKFASDEFKQHVRELQELAALSIGNESRELILVGHAFAIAGEAGQIFRPVPNSDWGIDGEIEFMDWHGNASGQRVYLQLKSGDSHLDERQRDKSEVFRMKKPRWADYWMAHNYPVMLVIRTSDKRIRWMNVTQYLTRKKESGEWPVNEIIFDGEDFSPLNLLRLRKSLLPPPEDRIAL
jgi:hypothetical protein